jgi:hypothetical protein
MERKVSSSEAFESRAAEAPRSAVSEVLAFAFNNKKWWLAPIIVVLLGLGLLVILGGTAAAPFIYTLF